MKINNMNIEYTYKNDKGEVPYVKEIRDIGLRD